jgi:putative two-component system response regulator
VEGRIAAIADSFDALTSDRPYRGALTVDAAEAVMRGERGSHFDPDLLDLFLGSLDRA